MLGRILSFWDGKFPGAMLNFQGIWMFPKIGVPPNHPFHKVFHYKPSILGYPYFWETPIYNSSITSPHSTHLASEAIGTAFSASPAAKLACWFPCVFTRPYRGSLHYQPKQCTISHGKSRKLPYFFACFTQNCQKKMHVLMPPKWVPFNAQYIPR